MTDIQHAQSHYYHFCSSGVGIYEAVERDCPRTDARRSGKPDGGWLPKIGPKFPGALSFWTALGKAKYEQSGLRDWHESVCKEPVEILISTQPDKVLYEDDYQVICSPDSVRPTRIRAARPGDALGIAHVHVQAWKETYSGLIPESILQGRRVVDKAKLWEQSIQTSREPAAHTLLLVAEDFNGQIIGWNTGGGCRESILGYDAELYAIYLLKRHHGSGIGSLLFRELARWLKLQKHSRMMLWVLEENPTVNFYERMGGKLLGITKELDFGERKCLEQAYGWDL